MVLELCTFVLLAVVLAMKYGSVTRIFKLRHRLREAEARCFRNREQLKLYQLELRLIEREEAGLVRQRQNLEEELKRLTEELEELKHENGTLIQDLLKKNLRVDPNLQQNSEL